MHLVTSSMFLPSHLHTLSPSSTFLLLRSYVSTCLLWWIARGRPIIDIVGFYKSTSKTLTSFTESQSNFGLNPWTSIIDQSVKHPDEHLPKLIRSLLHFSTIYGCQDFKHLSVTSSGGAELNGVVDTLDGTLFLRAAMLTKVRMEQGNQASATENGITAWDMVMSSADLAAL